MQTTRASEKTFSSCDAVFFGGGGTNILYGIGIRAGVNLGRAERGLMFGGVQWQRRIGDMFADAAGTESAK